jgi:hypothetical protein
VSAEEEPKDRTTEETLTSNKPNDQCRQDKLVSAKARALERFWQTVQAENKKTQNGQ